MSSARRFLAGATLGAVLVVLGIVALLMAPKYELDMSDVSFNELLSMAVGVVLMAVGAILALLGGFAAVFVEARDDEKNSR